MSRAAKAFATAKKRAAVVVEDPGETAVLADDALEKADRNRTAFGDAYAEVRRLIRMVKAYAGREYTEIPVQTLLLMVGAVVYFVMPVDAIPDFIPGVGLLDDAAVFMWVLSSIRADVERFGGWEVAQRR